MSILIKSGEKYFEVSSDVLERCGISEEQFEKKRIQASHVLATEMTVPKTAGGCDLVDLSAEPD